jgi:hypothetical protein
MVSLAAVFLGRWAVAVTIVLMIALGLRGLLGTRYSGWSAIASIGCGALALWVLPADGWWWLGLPVTIGCLVHDLGDMCTTGGCPVLWPLRRCGQAWHRYRPLGRCSFDVNSPTERCIMRILALVLAAGWIALVLV